MDNPHSKSARISQLHQSMTNNSTMKIYQLEYKCLLVLHDFQAEALDELTCQSGTELCGITLQDGWWLARKRNEKRLGLIPESFVQEIPVFPSDQKATLKKKGTKDFKAVSSKNPAYVETKKISSANASSSIAESDETDPEVAIGSRHTDYSINHDRQIQPMLVLEQSFIGAKPSQDYRRKKYGLILVFIFIFITAGTAGGFALSNQASAIGQVTRTPTFFGDTIPPSSLVPTLSPTPAPLRVLCEFNFKFLIVQLFIGGIDRTSQIIGNLNDFSKSKFIEFDDIIGSKMVFAILGSGGNGNSCARENLSGFIARCTSVSSRWNIQTNVNTWRGIRSLDAENNVFNPDWNDEDPTQQEVGTVVSAVLDLNLNVSMPGSSKLWIGNHRNLFTCTNSFVAFRTVIEDDD